MPDRYLRPPRELRVDNEDWPNIQDFFAFPDRYGGSYPVNEEAYAARHRAQRHARPPRKDFDALLAPAASGDLFWRLPAVEYLTDRIPAAKLVLRPDPMVAVYLQQAKDADYSLRKQCDELGIPWSARLLEGDELTKEAVMVAAFLPSSVFAQTKAPGNWAHMVLQAYRLNCVDEAIVWVAFHAAEIDSDDIDYIATLENLHRSTSAATVCERSREWHEQADAEMFKRKYGYRMEASANVPAGMEEFVFAGYRFKALMSFGDFRDESKVMHHCVWSRFSMVSQCLYYSVTDAGNGNRAATIEFAREGRLLEAKGFGNAQVPDDVMQAAWLVENRIRQLRVSDVSEMERERVLKEVMEELGVVKDEPKEKGPPQFSWRKLFFG